MEITKHIPKGKSLNAYRIPLIFTGQLASNIVILTVNGGPVVLTALYACIFVAILLYAVKQLVKDYNELPRKALRNTFSLCATAIMIAALVMVAVLRNEFYPCIYQSFSPVADTGVIGGVFYIGINAIFLFLAAKVEHEEWITKAIRERNESVNQNTNH